MKKSEYRRRTHLRLPFYDYSQYGCYFVTICAKNRFFLFGQIVNGEMQLNEIGKIVKIELLNLLHIYPNSLILDYVIMPNHLHFIWFNQDDIALSRVIKSFKGNAVTQYRHFIYANKREYKPLWQRSFYEHIIRDDKDYERIADYIENNPLQWELDRFYNQ
ncbi:transposase [Basfia succiniciproducens]|uniref:REP element-mobilizing transposase RayT n=1 Tax=Basfia succiniciproducens TaxID=653940 RepID=A0A1G5E1F0_9PAST|nr:transposase [Basfia succiniciproducens]QIM68708.1 transposase [Basfia succiniciproducens]SCY20903.1 REP element-mobilizing transposase RayT [Basfia succiniciproducens]